MNTNDAILSLQNGLDSIPFVVEQLDAAIDNAGFFAPEGAISAAEAQIRNLENIQKEVGPRLIARIRSGETPKIAQLQDLIRNATISSQEIGYMLETEVSVPAALSYVGEMTWQGVKETAKEAAKITAPLGLIVAAAFILFLLKK